MQVRWNVFRTGTGSPLPSFNDYKQCCGSGSEIRCLFDSWILDPGCVKNQDLGSTTRIFPRA
jgi:hypothetical protein